jgi:hypothetical protein
MAAIELYIDRSLAHRAEAVQSAAFLIGGYAGWPNFGDYLQLKSTIDIHEQIGAIRTVFVVLDAHSPAGHERSQSRGGPYGSNVFPVYYHSGGAETAGNSLDGLIPLRHVPPSMLVHVYGGGFINDWWGRTARHAVRVLLERHARDNIDGELRLFISGQQVSCSAEAEAWRPFFKQAEYIGARDHDTVALIEELIGDSTGKVKYSGDDALLALVAGCKANAQRYATPSIAAHVNLADYSSPEPERRLQRLVQALAAAARHFAAGVTCELLVAYPSDHVREEEAVWQLQAVYDHMVATGAAPRLSFRVRNIFAEAVSGSLHFDASFLVSCSYHVALMGLLSHCPTLMLVENDYYRQKAAGLLEAFKGHKLATAKDTDETERIVGSLLEDKTNQAHGNGAYAMWIGQAEKAMQLSRICLDMDRAAARQQLELTATAFRDVAANLGELRKRRILEERLAKEV